MYLYDEWLAKSGSENMAENCSWALGLCVEELELQPSAFLEALGGVNAGLAKSRVIHLENSEQSGVFFLWALPMYVMEKWLNEETHENISSIHTSHSTDSSKTESEGLRIAQKYCWNLALTLEPGFHLQFIVHYLLLLSSAVSLDQWKSFIEDWEFQVNYFFLTSYSNFWFWKSFEVLFWQRVANCCCFDFLYLFHIWIGEV